MSNERNLMSQYWCFTLNNPTEDDIRLCRGLVESGEASYLIFGHEHKDGGEGGTQTYHLQGYVEFNARKRRSSVSNLQALRRAFLQVRKGTSEQARAYCTKEPGFEEFGLLSSPERRGVGAKKSKLSKALDAIRNGANEAQLWLEHAEAMVLYGERLKKAILHLQPVPDRHTYDLDSFNVELELPGGFSYVIYGPPGIGKTAYMTSRFPTCLLVSHMDQLGDFDPSKHEAIVFDDMSFSHLPRTAQIHIVDWDYERAIHIRYGCAIIPANTPKFFLTNTMDIFDFNDAAISRRVKVIPLLNNLFE